MSNNFTGIAAVGKTQKNGSTEPFFARRHEFYLLLLRRIAKSIAASAKMQAQTEGSGMTAAL